MSFSNEWDEAYRKNEQMSIWPWSDLVSYIYRYTDIAKHPGRKVLELGCGAGANIRLLSELHADYYACDGSDYIIEMLKEKYPQYASNLVAADFTENIPFQEKFDVIFDRGALTHNNTESIKKTIEGISNLLKSGGIYIGITYFSSSHDDAHLGEFIDENTRMMGNVGGQFNNLGQVHFSDEAHLKELFKDFKFEVLQEQIVDSYLPKKHRFAAWNFVVRK